MKKMQYQQPTLHIVNIHIENSLLAGSGGASKVAGNASFNENISAGSGEARSRSFDDDWDE